MTTLTYEPLDTIPATERQRVRRPGQLRPVRTECPACEKVFMVPIDPTIREGLVRRIEMHCDHCGHAHVGDVRCDVEGRVHSRVTPKTHHRLKGKRAIRELLQRRPELQGVEQA